MISGLVFNNFAVVYAFDNASFMLTLFSGNLVLAVKCHFSRLRGIERNGMEQFSHSRSGDRPSFSFPGVRRNGISIRKSNSLEWSWMGGGCSFCNTACHHQSLL
ncbi:unnamed protein product [Ixodes pacificus]